MSHISKMSKPQEPDATGTSLAHASQHEDYAERDPSVRFPGSTCDLLVEGVLVPYIEAPASIGKLIAFNCLDGFCQTQQAQRPTPVL